MNSPTLTIALQTYNRCSSGYLRQSLESILAQSYNDFELLVLDNHSTDETAELILSYKDPRLTYIRQPPGGSPSTNFNRGLWMSRGQYVLLTHDDDIMEPTMVERQMTFLAEHPDLLCLATNVSLINEDGSLIQPRLYDFRKNRIFQVGEYIPTYLAEKLWLPTPTCLFNRNSLISWKPTLARSIDPEYFPSGDILVLCELNLKGRIAILETPLLRYRQHSGQESRNVNQSEPLVYLAEQLLKNKRANPRIKPHLPAIHAIHARFQAQDALFKVGGSDNTDELVRELKAIKGKWQKSVAESGRLQDAVLPFEILLCQHSVGKTIRTESLEQLENCPANSGSRDGYRNWVRTAHEGRSIFERRPEFRKIAILGSMFTAFLLVQEARKSGIEVTCCLDTSPARRGSHVLGVPVVPHEELRRMPFIDAVILSSERDHESGLKEILKPNLPAHDLTILSWKELSRESQEPEIAYRKVVCE